MSTRINNIFCIGRNYAEHARELGNTVPKTPVVFLKPNSAYLDSPKVWELPRAIGQVDHEAELVLRIGVETMNVAVEEAWSVVESVAIGIDFTARELQTEAKTRGLPWLNSKGRKGFAPVSDFIPLVQAGHGPFEIGLWMNGELRQSASTEAMVFPLPVLISFLAQTYGLKAGDLVFTGTPAGVGAVERGERLRAQLKSATGAMAQLEFQIT